MILGKKYKTTRGDVVLIHSVSKCGNYGIYGAARCRIHISNLLGSESEGVEALAHKVVDSSNAVKSARVEVVLQKKLSDNERKLQAILQGVSEPSWWRQAIEVTPLAALAYTGAVGAICLASIHLYKYVL